MAIFLNWRKYCINIHLIKELKLTKNQYIGFRNQSKIELTKEA